MRKKECVAMLLAGGQGSRLGVLTEKIAKPAVSFGGKYRMIDFSLSNCVNSGIDTVGVLIQYKPSLLNRYLGTGAAWDLDAAWGGVHILPPYATQTGGEWYEGTADAIYHNIDFLDGYDPEYVIILSGDHLYQMDYNLMLDFHKLMGADLTVAVKTVPWEEASRFGIMSVDQDMRITRFAEKPKKPESNLASMGIYIFTWPVLRAALLADHADEQSDKDFGKNIIPNMLNAGEKLWPYRFDGYWRDVGTITSLWDANMDMLSTTLINLFDPSWPIRSRSTPRPPHYVGEDAKVVHSIVTEGCVIEGEVENSVLSSSAKVGKGAKVLYSVLMPGAVVEDNAVVEYSILGENTVVKSGAHVGAPPDGSDAWGVATCGPNIEIRQGAEVPAGAMIYKSEEV